MKALRYFYTLTILIISGSNITHAESICFTPYLSCQIPQNVPLGYKCFCNTPTGPIVGITGTSEWNRPERYFPSFCCTPAGKFGPFPNTNISVGGICHANTPYGPVIGQACH